MYTAVPFGTSATTAPIHWLLGAWLAFWSTMAPAALTDWPPRPVVRFTDVRIDRINEQLTFSMQMQIRLSRAIVEALEHAVALEFVTEIVLQEELSLLGVIPNPRIIARYRIPVRLSYRHFDHRWLLFNRRSGQVLALDDLTEALEILGAFDHFPLIDIKQMHLGPPYAVRVRFRLDRNRLPAPLWIRTWLDTGWRLDTGWQTFHVNEDLLW